MSTDLIVARVDQARGLLAEARDAQDAKRVADMAHAAEVYARRQKLSEEAIAYAHEICIEAKALLGEFLKTAPKNEGAAGRPGPGRGKNAVPISNRVLDATPTLADIGITKKESAEAQFIAEVKEKSPDTFTAIKQGEKTLTEAKRIAREEKREARREENREKVAKVEAPDRLVGAARFATIAIDPPWDWGDEGDIDQMGRAKPQYETMSLEKLLDLPVEKLADVDCHLYLWITNRSLPKGFQLIDRWGFRYVTCITWVKPHFGMGNYFRGQTEQILFAVRGSQPLRRKDQGTVIYAPRGKEHSSKPEEFYAMVNSCSPGPYLEMFGRYKRRNWTVWGEDS